MPDSIERTETRTVLWFDDDMHFLEQQHRYIRRSFRMPVEFELVQSLRSALDSLAHKTRGTLTQPKIMFVAQHERPNPDHMFALFREYKFSAIVSDLDISGDTLAGLTLLATAAVQQQPNLILCTARADASIVKVATSLQVTAIEKRQVHEVFERIIDALSLRSEVGNSSHLEQQIVFLDSEVAKLRLERRKLRRRIADLQKKNGHSGSTKTRAASGSTNSRSASLEQMQRVLLSHNHDLNSISSFISQALEGLCANQNLIPPAVYPDLQRARVTARYLDVLVRGMSSVVQPDSKVESGVSKIGEAVKATSDILHSKISGRISVEYTGHDTENLCAVPGDLLIRILVNVVLNAIEAMPKGGTITIRSHRARSRKHVVIEVRDSGRGIKKADLPRIFESTFSTKGKHHGFGLFIVRKTIADYKGKVEIKSIRGKGTIVRLELPSA
jgi:signal transduction histidine kinase